MKLNNWQVVHYISKRLGPYQAEIIDAKKEALLQFKQLLQRGEYTPAELSSATSFLRLEDDPKRLLNRYKRSAEQAHTKSIELGLERILSENNIQDIRILDQLKLVAEAVGRIDYQGQPYGTGFRVSKNLLLTNHHVIASVDAARSVTVNFRYQIDSDGNSTVPIRFKLDPDKFFLTSPYRQDPSIPESGLDFTLVALSDTSIDNSVQLSEIPNVQLDGTNGKIVKGEICIVIQHPNGEPKKIVLRDNLFFSETNTRIVYESDTLRGSSGSPVVALGTGEVIALHHTSIPRTNSAGEPLTKSGTIATPDTPDDTIDWVGNAGVKVSRIVVAVQNLVLPPSMEPLRAEFLALTKERAKTFGEPTARTDLRSSKVETSTLVATSVPSPTPQSQDSISPSEPISSLKMSAVLTPFILYLDPRFGSVKQIEAFLAVKFPTSSPLALLERSLLGADLPALYTVDIPVAPELSCELAEQLRLLPGVMGAEPDLPLYTDANEGRSAPTSGRLGTESGSLLLDDGLEVNNEEKFLTRYSISPYVSAATSKIEIRQWNLKAIKYDAFISAWKSGARGTSTDPFANFQNQVRIVQFDTGYTAHLEVQGGLDYSRDYSFLEDDDSADDPQNRGILKFPGHGTRTASLVIGSEFAPLLREGNHGLLAPFGIKLIPYRIVETVLLFNRQQELAAAVEKAIVQGHDVITMSLGTAPTLTTARLAKRAYDAGIIWCCAAGNEVRAVVAPAVFPGTIAVAASNPFDQPWQGSSFGDRVDITAPGEDVHVPIYSRDEDGNIIQDYAYGSGTSYATPQVASAAALWLCKYESILQDYLEPWKRVEAFRQALKDSARTSPKLPSGYGAGILDVNKLLNTRPPNYTTRPGTPYTKLKNAYDGLNESAFFAAASGWFQVGKTLWNSIWRKRTSPGFKLTESIAGLEAMAQAPRLTMTQESMLRSLLPSQLRAVESSGPLTEVQSLAAFSAVTTKLSQILSSAKA